jgi:hypothetical protein
MGKALKRFSPVPFKKLSYIRMITHIIIRLRLIKKEVL